MKFYGYEAKIKSKDNQLFDLTIKKDGKLFFAESADDESLLIDAISDFSREISCGRTPDGQGRHRLRLDFSHLENNGYEKAPDGSWSKKKIWLLKITQGGLANTIVERMDEKQLRLYAVAQLTDLFENNRKKFEDECLTHGYEPKL